MSLPDDVSSTGRSAPPKFIQGMALRCLFALSLLAGIAIAGFLVTHGKSSLFRGYETLVNLAGRQRVLTVNAARLAGQLERTQDPANSRRFADELSRLADELEKNHSLILVGHDASGVAPAPPAVRRIFLEPPHRLDDVMLSYLSEIRALINEAANPEQRAQAGNRLNTLLDEGGILESMDAVVAEYRHESLKSAARVRAMETTILAATLVVIALTGMGVFRPMFRQVNVETDKLGAFNTILDDRNAELARTLQALEQERDERRARMQAMAKVLEDLEDERGKLEREIQARQLVQEALEASEQRFYAIIESAPTAMIMTDHHGEIVLANAETERLFGYEREEILGKPIKVLVPGWFRDQQTRVSPNSEVVPESQRMGIGRSLFALQRGGTEVPIEIGLNPIETEEGTFVLSAIVDITERQRQQEEIKRINKELQSKNNEMQQFVYTVSHDLKSPLVTCRGFVGLMKEDAAEGRWDDVLDSVSRIERATQRMGDLIEDLLQLSRIGVIRNEPENIDVSPMVRGITDDMAERLQQAGARLEIVEPLPRVYADRVRLAEVFENLVSNAIKYGCRGGNGQIQIGGNQNGSEVLYFVRDNGPGIAKEFHQKVFGLFQRLDSNEEGTGVGLAAVARIMEIHGGRVWVESEVGQGATFWVAFPSRYEMTSDGAPPQSLATLMESPVGT